MKNDWIGLFTRLKTHDGAYNNTEFSVPVLASAFGCTRGDFESGKFFQVDHFIPQSPHLDPANPFDSEFITALEMHPDQLKEVNGRDVYVVRGAEIIDAVFEKFLPDLPADMRPGIDNIVNLRPLTSVANNRKSNRLSGTMEMMFETLCGHASGYEKHLGAASARASILDLCNAFMHTDPEIVQVLEAIDVVDRARVDSGMNKGTHMELAGFDLLKIFANAGKGTGFEDGFELQKYMARSRNENVTGNPIMVEKMTLKGMRLTEGFTGTVIDLTGNFRESFERFRTAFVTFAKTELHETNEARREVGVPPRLIAA